MMDERKLQKGEIFDGVQLYRGHFCDFGFMVGKPRYMKRGSEVMKIAKRSDNEIIVGVSIHKTPEDFKEWLDYHKL